MKFGIKILPTLLIVFFTIGCASTPPKLVATFNDTQSDKKLSNDLIEEPVFILSSFFSDEKPVDLILSFERTKRVHYDMVTTWKKVNIMRELVRTERTKKDNVVVGILSLALLQTFTNKDRQYFEERKQALDSKAEFNIRNGKGVFTGSVDYINTVGGASFRHHYRYWSEIVDSNISTTQNHSWNSIKEKANNLPIKIKSDDGLIEISSNTGKNSVVNIPLISDLRTAEKLQPTILQILVNYKGQWKRVEQVRLMEPQISKIKDYMTAKNFIAEGAPFLPPFANVSLTIPKIEQKADTKFEISLTVKNTGKGEFYRLSAISKSNSSILNGIKFKFGKIEPGESRTVTKTIYIPRKHENGHIYASLNWSELNGYQPDPVPLKIMVRGLPKPKFAMNFRVIDDNSGNSVGNGDGVIQKGEAVDLLIIVKNIGEGDAKDTLITLSNPNLEGVIHNVDKVVLGRLRAGETKRARLTITSKKSVNVKKINPLLSIQDRYLDVQYNEPLALKIDSALPPRIMNYNFTAYVAEKEVAFHSGASHDSTIIARAKQGTSLNATGELDNWIRVKLPKIGDGWVKKDSITPNPPVDNIISSSVPVNNVIEIIHKTPPTIALLKPKDNSKVTSSKLIISGIIFDSRGINHTEFKLNGIPIQAKNVRDIKILNNRNPKFDQEYRFELTAILVEGHNSIQIRAQNIDGITAEKNTTIIYEKNKGQIYLVCIGIDKYKMVSKLNYAVADARSIASSFEQHLKVPKKNIHLITDEQATLRHIKNILGEKIRKESNKNDTVIIYFAGHGAPEADRYSLDQDGVAKYLLPVDADSSALFSTALPMEEVKTIFNRLISDRVIFIADTCYSGAVGGRTVVAQRTKFRSINQSNLLYRLRGDTGSGRVIMTASKGGEVSQEKSHLGHGVFTYYFIKGLEGRADTNNDTKVTVTEIFDYVSKKVPKETDNTQHPLISMDELVGDFVLSILD